MVVLLIGLTGWGQVIFGKHKAESYLVAAKDMKVIQLGPLKGVLFRASQPHGVSSKTVHLPRFFFPYMSCCRLRVGKVLGGVSIWRSTFSPSSGGISEDSRS